MPTKLNGLHWMAYHLNDSDWQFIRRVRPTSIKIFNDNWRDPFFVERVFAETAPFGTLILFRDHPLSEQHGQVYDNPIGTGQAHAQFWQNMVATHLAGIKGFDASRSLFLNANELIPDTANSIKAITDYNVSFADTLKGSGLRGGLMNLSVGWPTNTGTDTPVNWQPFTPVRDAIKRGNHVMLLHEYFANWQGTNFNRGWWIDRLGQCPWDVPIILGEGGVDNYVDWQWAQQVSDQTKRGWSGYWNKEEYITAIGQLDAIYRGDRRVHSVMLFTYDFAHPWHSFDIRPMQMELAAYFDRANAMPDPPALPIPRYPSNVIIEEPNMSDQLAAMLKARFGTDFEDLRGKLTTHPTNKYARRGLSQIAGYALHHTGSGTSRSTTWNQVADYHVNSHGWPGPAYTIGIRQEGGRVKVSLINDLEAITYHVGDANPSQLAFCVMGNFVEVLPTSEEVNTLRAAVAVTDDFLKRKPDIRPHSYFRNTTCPAKWAEIIPTLRIVTPPYDPAYEADKARWNSEEAIRRIEAGKPQEARALLLAEVSPRLLKLENHLKGKT